VTGLGGSVFVDSTLGNGTTFRVLLPVASTGASIRQLGAAKSFGQVLVVDDELAVRETTARMLRASGYQVVTAGSIDQARGILNDTSVACDALLTDVVLHNERGFELLADCRRLRPDACIVVMSGFAPEPEAAVALQESAAGFLPKPFTIDELCAALRD
jgi:two-component system, cell cycle sensor histidine kinase and response regulator CckA